MSLFPFNEFWYEAELAKHSRSRCIAKNCREIIGKGELRIGVMCEDKNDSHGWYHAVCLWDNFGEKFNENPRITKVEDIKNYERLSADITTRIQELIDQAEKERVDKIADISACTYSKHTLAEDGAEVLPEASPYAMSGTITVKLDKNQDIYVSGDVVHTGDKLKGYGAYFKEYNNTGWMFSCTERAGARKFLCMPDELPKVGKSVVLDLAELGRQQAAADGATITPAEQADAEIILRILTARHVAAGSAYKRAKK